MLLNNIAKLGKILKETNRLSTVTEFNASLPIKIEIKEKLNPIRYKILLGKKEVETKSYIPLEVGKKYIAQIRDKKGAIEISNLRQLPKILDYLEDIKTDKKEVIFNKQEILHHLQNASSKNEFIFFSNIFFSLIHHKIHHLLINEKKKALLQFKYQKNRVKFYAIFTHLNELEGEVTPLYVKIISPFDSVLQVIEQYKNELNLEIYLEKKDTISPLYKFSNSLINLKV